MFNRIFAALGLLGVAACGGSSSGGAGSSGPTVDPVSPAGFATASSAVTGGDTFQLQDAYRLLGDDEGNIVIDQQDVSYSISPDASTVTLVVEGETYVLDAGFTGYEFSDGSTFITATRIFAPTPEAEIVDVFAVVDNELNDSSFVIGFDTAPAAVSARTGTAEMNGEAFLTAREGFELTAVDGTVTLNVDFDDNSIGGDINFFDGSLELERTAIVDNGFTGDVSVASGDIEGTLSNGIYDGRFFGSDASAAGGQIVCQLSSGGETAFIEGAFLAVE